MHLVVIGIDRYQLCGKLQNAVGDARGALEAFTAAGFQPRATLLDEDATGEALHRLVTNDLRSLDKEDSLVVFFAGHGYTETTTFDDGTTTKVGYLVPVDGSRKRVGTCLRLRTWLDELTHLQVRHILVILDSCQSGIALEPMLLWHSGDPPPLPGTQLEQVQLRRSRRVITSALAHQFASDCGPKPGHSLFTGYLLEALAGGASFGDDYTTTTTIGAYLLHHVVKYTRARQTPGFGVLPFDNHGELILPLRTGGKVDPPLQLPEPQPAVRTPRPPLPQPAGPPGGSSSRGGTAAKPQRGPRPKIKAKAEAKIKARPTAPPPRQLPAPPSRQPSASTTWPPFGAAGRPARQPPRFPDPAPLPVPTGPGVRAGWDPAELRAGAGKLDDAFTASLERQAVQRRCGGLVMSLIAGEPRAALTAVATWSAQRGRLTLVTQATALDVVARELIAHMPWFRCLPAARAKLAAAARLEVIALEAALDARSGLERRAWVEGVAAGNATVRVAGWLLSSLRDPLDSLDPRTAPVQGRELITALGELSSPIAVCLHHEEPVEAWLKDAVSAAAALAGWLPLHSVAVTAPKVLADRLRDSRNGTAALSMAKQGTVFLETARVARRDPASRPSPPATDARALEQALWDAMARDPRTRGRFERRVPAPIHEREGQVEVLLAARSARLIVELDGWYHLRDPQAYRRARLKDIWLQRAGFFAMRFLAEDVERRLGAVIDEIARGLEGRRVTKRFP